MAYKFEIFKDKNKQHRFRFVAPNGEIMFQSEAYTQKHSALATIDVIKKQVTNAILVEGKDSV